MTPTLTHQQSRGANRRRGRTCPALRLVASQPRGAPTPTESEVFSDLLALVSAGLIEPVQDGRGQVRYRVAVVDPVVDPFTGAGALDDTNGGAA